MFDQYLSINRILRSTAKKVSDCIYEINYDPTYVPATIARYIKEDIRGLRCLWPHDLDQVLLDRICAECEPPTEEKYQVIADELLPEISDTIDRYFRTKSIASYSENIRCFMHPLIIESSYDHYKSGKFRDSVLNSIVAVFDMIRRRTGLDMDGSSLVDIAYSPLSPKLVFSTLETESGRNDQKGFMQILKGVYQGVRNPKAHSLEHDLTEVKAAQYLVLASLLARRIEDSRNADE